MLQLFLVSWTALALVLGTGRSALAMQGTDISDPVPAPRQVEPELPPGGVLEEIGVEAAQPESGLVTGGARPGPVTGGDPASRQRLRLLREAATGSTALERLQSALGLAAFVALAWAISVDRRAVRWKPVVVGVALQFIFGIVILTTAPGREFFDALNDVFVALLGYTTEGARFIFGNLALNNVPVGPADGPMAPVASTGTWANTGAYFAFNVLPTIIFFSSLMTLLYYTGVMQFVVRAFAWVMVRAMGTSGAESLNAAGNIFVGQTEAPLLIKPFVRTMTMSELHAVMTGGFATIAGGVLAAFVGMLAVYFPSIAGHLIAASVMSAPAALAISKVMYPETEEPATRGEVRVELERTDANAIDAAARGAAEGLHLALNVGAMLLAFVALIALLNAILGGIAGWFGADLTLQVILGWIGAPFAWLMGVSWDDARIVGVLIGEKTAVNEFVAYLHLAELLQSGSDLSARSVVITTYALCGFANFSSIAIQIGGIGGIAPERRGDLSRLGLRAMIAGTLAGFMTACVVGILM